MKEVDQEEEKAGPRRSGGGVIWIPLGLSFGSGIGVAVGAAFGAPVIGVALGSSLGLCLGVILMILSAGKLEDEP